MQLISTASETKNLCSATLDLELVLKLIKMVVSKD